MEVLGTVVEDEGVGTAVVAEPACPGIVVEDEVVGTAVLEEPCCPGTVVATDAVGTAAAVPALGVEDRVVVVDVAVGGLTVVAVVDPVAGCEGPDTVVANPSGMVEVVPLVETGGGVVASAGALVDASG